MSFKTLQKSDIDFKKYLLGTFSDTEVAVPVKTLNVGQFDETVTFEIVKTSEIQRPAYLVYLAHLIKLKSYLLIMVPLFYVAFKNYLDDRFFDPFSFTFASVAILFLYAGLNLRSDLNDHVSGFDRVIEPAPDKPLLRGWITGAEVNLISLFCIGVSGFLSVPVLLLQKEALRVLAIVVVLFFLGQFFKKNSFKNQRFGEFILFLIIGPGLCSGLQVSLGAGIDTEILAFGSLWGVAVLFLVHLNNFSHLLSSSQAGILNTMNKMGFDLSKRFLVFWLALMNLCWIIFHYFYAGTFWTWFVGLVFIFWSIPTAIQFSNIASPLGSDLILVKKTGYKNFLLMIVLLFIEQIWYFGNKINWNL